MPFSFRGLIGAWPVACVAILVANPTRMRSILTVVWYAAAAVLVAAFSAYAYLRSSGDVATIIGDLAVLVICLGLLFYAEGAEVAGAILLDKDVEQIPEGLRPSFERLQHSHAASGAAAPFISGRQFLIAVPVVGLTILCAYLSDITLPNPVPGGLPGLIILSLSQKAVQIAFTLLFPVFMPLWLAQLPPKSVAHRDPVRTYSWEMTRLAISAAVAIGEYLRIDAPSGPLINLLDRLPAPIRPLGPGRRTYYETSARLRGGKAISNAYVHLSIARDGSIEAVERVRYRAFVPGRLCEFPQEVYWEAPIEPGGISVRSVGGSRNIPHVARFNRTFEKMEEGQKWHVAEWTATLHEPLEENEECEVEIRYRAGAGAVKAEIGGTDWYFYRVYLVPHASFTFEVVTPNTEPIVVVNADVEARATEDEAVNQGEAQRVEREWFEDETKAGYRYTVSYPLLATKFQFKWTLERR